jgi:radical SAM superfamily enzyme YgiQ (UPF0313 family)
MNMKSRRPIELAEPESNQWPLIRFIAPAYPEVNIFSGSKIVPLGLINVATAAGKVWGWRVEIIVEELYRGPRDSNGLPDHKKLQEENPADVVGFYCGLTSTMDRVFALAKFYSDQGCINIAGGWHAHYCPEEALNHDIDVVVHGDGELAIREIISAIDSRKHGEKEFSTIKELSAIAGISYWGKSSEGDGEVRQITNPPGFLELPDLSALPYPNFGLIRYPKKITTYPIGRTRGCRMNCEFCSVKGKPRWADPRHTFNVIKWLVDTRKAKSFFIGDDRLDEDREGLIKLLDMIRETYGDRLRFTVQIRLETAKDTELLSAMRRAGVRTVCIGYESPIAEDLIAMHKGLSPKKMIEWTLILRQHFWVHGMFIFGYPNSKPSALSVPETVKRYKSFIRQTRMSSIQVLHPVPLVGTELRSRLESDGRIFPLELVPWSKYDGNYACFQPDNMSIEELQNTPLELMKWFYSRWSFWRIPFRTLTFPIHYPLAGWHHWYDGWLRDVVKYGGHRILVKWFRSRSDKRLISALREYVKVKTS